MSAEMSAEVECGTGDSTDTGLSENRAFAACGITY